MTDAGHRGDSPGKRKVPKGAQTPAPSSTLTTSGGDASDPLDVVMAAWTDAALPAINARNVKAATEPLSRRLPQMSEDLSAFEPRARAIIEKIDKDLATLLPDGDASMAAGTHKQGKKKWSSSMSLRLLINWWLTSWP